MPHRLQTAPVQSPSSMCVLILDIKQALRVLTTFVALEGKGAMKDVASCNMDPLAEYVDTPANQKAGCARTAQERQAG